MRLTEAEIGRGFAVNAGPPWSGPSALLELRAPRGCETAPGGDGEERSGRLWAPERNTFGGTKPLLAPILWPILVDSP